MQRIVLLFSSPDKPGIVAAVATEITRGGGNIVDSMQHNATDSGRFFMRVEWEEPATESLPQEGMVELQERVRARFQPLAEAFNMDYQIWALGIPQRMAIMVSRQLHCLYDLLWQRKEGHLPHCEVVAVVSNHRDAEEICRWMDIPFHYTAGDGESEDGANSADSADSADRVRHKKEAVEQEQLRMLRRYAVDLIALARYMQILSPVFIDRYAMRIINIHHSFLPAFVGAKPYHQAYMRGVKIIGATSHYATAQLDQGPIIEQDVTRVSHRDDIETIIRHGNILERAVLARAVRLHLQRRILVVGNKTIVFS